MATGASSNWAVWVASQRNLDLRLYHATKYTLLAEINIRQCVAQKLASKLYWEALSSIPNFLTS